jgi:rod shape-determining protein MreC
MKTIIEVRGASLQAVFLVALSIAMMVVDHRFQHLEIVRTNLSLAISPIKYLVSLPSTGGNWLGEWFTSHTELLN